MTLHDLKSDNGKMPSIEQLSQLHIHRARTLQALKLAIFFGSVFTLGQAYFFAFVGGSEVVNKTAGVISVGLNAFTVLVLGLFGLLNFVMADKLKMNKKKTYYISIHALLLICIGITLGHIHIGGSSCSLLPIQLFVLAVLAAWLIGWKEAWFYYALGNVGLLSLFLIEKAGLLPFFPLHAKSVLVPTEIFLEGRYLGMSAAIFMVGGGAALAMISKFQCLLQERNDQLLKSLRQLRLLASSDPLTGLLNRRRAFERVTEEMERSIRTGTPMTIALIDLDNFKKINDSYGHPVGDKVIESVADILTKGFRTYDVVARVGGEEFMVAIPDADMAKSYALLDRIRVTIEKAAISNISAGAGTLTASFGFTQYDPKKPADLKKLFSRADKALYFAKSRGKNRISYYHNGNFNLTNSYDTISIRQIHKFKSVLSET